MEEEIQRIPRPYGATYMSKQYQSDPSKTNKGRLRALILKAYIANQLYQVKVTDTHLKARDKTKPLPGSQQRKNTKKYKELSITNIELADFSYLSLVLGIRPSKVEERVQRLLIKDSSNIASQQAQIDLNAYTRVVTNGLLNKALGTLPKASEWAEELKASTRIKGYSPGMIAGTNMALSQEITIIKQAFDMASKLGMIGTQPSQTQVNILNQHGTQPDQQGTLMTPTMALKMIEDAGLTKVPLDEESLALKYGINNGSLPDVKALPTDKQGGNNFDPKMISFTKDHHDTHREREEGIMEIDLDIRPHT